MKALVLLSGLDSAIAMHWAISVFAEVEAISFWYGQPHAAAEIAASQTIAMRREVPWSSIHLAEAVRGLAPIEPPKPGLVGGVSRANLPGRNMILLSVAAARAATRWPGGQVAIVIGANMDDAIGFPDCRAAFLSAAGAAMRTMLAGVADIEVRAPWVELQASKADVLRWATRQANSKDILSDARESVSCYLGARCGACDACTLRASAFSAAGLKDGDGLVMFTGGDQWRDRH